MASQENLKFRVLVPVYFGATQRQMVADKIIQRIISRTQDDNKDKDGKRFPGYSTGYKNSLDFRIAGKSKSRVDLTLSGDMLAELDTIEHAPGFIEIGYKSSSDQAGKVEGNVIGSYGRSASSSKARNFLGIEDKDLEEIINDVELSSPEVQAIQRSLDDNVNSILGRINFELE